jgi:Zn-dependent protease
MALEQPLQLPDPASSDWRERFKSSKLGRALRILVLPFILLASRLEALLALVGKLKYATALLSMFVSVGAYTLYWGLPFAVGFVLLLFVHEMGHVIQLRREGIRASAPYFIPFLGAVIGMREMPKHALAEARVGLAGPVLGTAGALAALAIGVLTDSDFFRALAFTGFFLNLFNLLPVSPLDGGRAAAAISPWLWLVGMLALAGFLFLHFNSFLLIIVLIGGMESISRLRNMRREKRERRESGNLLNPEISVPDQMSWADTQLGSLQGQTRSRAVSTRSWRKRPLPVGGEDRQRYYDVSPRARALVALTYVGLAAALAAGMALSHVSHIGS